MKRDERPGVMPLAGQYGASQYQNALVIFQENDSSVPRRCGRCGDHDDGKEKGLNGRLGLAIQTSAGFMRLPVSSNGWASRNNIIARAEVLVAFLEANKFALSSRKTNGAAAELTAPQAVVTIEAEFAEVRYWRPGRLMQVEFTDVRRMKCWWLVLKIGHADLRTI